MKYFCISKNHIIYFLVLFFICVNLTQIYGYVTTFREGNKLPKIKKPKGVSIPKGSNPISNIVDKAKDVGNTIDKGANVVGNTLEQGANIVGNTLEDVTNKAVDGAQNITGDLLGNLNVLNALKKLIEPVINLKNVVNDTLDFLQDF
jgi:hypothetical protein